ncbi:MAG: hypothetical protein J0I41_10665 [Filimonas sp.]|nr:hypothetical protein [Filimonas sp.]
MKRTTTVKLLIAIMSFAIANTAFAQKKSATTKQAVASTSGMTDQQAYAIIKYSNAVIDLHNSYVQGLESHQGTLESIADDNVKRLTRNSKTQPHWVDCNRNGLTSENDKANRQTLKNIPAIPEKQDLQQYGTQALVWYDKVNTWCSSISNYFTNKEYTNDANFVHYAVMRDSMQYSIKQAAAYWRAFTQLAADAGDRAELVLLNKNKLATFIIPMKQGLIGISKANKALNSEEVNWDSVTAKIAAMQSFVSQKRNDKTVDFSKLADVYYKEVYNNFYNACNDCLETLQFVVEKSREKTPATTEKEKAIAKQKEQSINSAYNMAMSAYNKAVGYYNVFIKQ